MLSSSINLQWPPFIQRAASDILTDYGPFVFGNRPVRTRTLGGVGAGGEKPPATRFGRIDVIVSDVSYAAIRSRCCDLEGISANDDAQPQVSALH